MTAKINETQEDKAIKQQELSAKAHMLINELRAKVVERDSLSSLLVLAIFSAQNIFLIGKPGVAKTKLIKIAMKAVKKSRHFEYLVRYDTKPEALFGDRYRADNGEIVHHKEHSVLVSDYVFLDEIFKGNSRLINGLLGITSEDREYHPEGGLPIKVPLKTLFGVSNELPDKETLEALNDRFMLRMEVERIQEDDNFYSMIQGDYDSSSDIQTSLALEDVDYVSKQGCDSIIIPEESGISYTRLKHTLIHNEAIEVSDRRLVGAIRNVMRVSAYLNNRSEIDMSDFFLLENIAWNNHVEQKKVKTAVYRHLFNSVQAVESWLNKASQEFNNINTYKQAQLNDFLSKKEIVSVENKEEYYLSHMEEITKVQRALVVNWQEHIAPAVEQLSSNGRIIEMCENNIFVEDKTDEVFTEEREARLRNIMSDYSTLDRYLTRFRESCPNARAYDNYTGDI